APPALLDVAARLLGVELERRAQTQCVLAVAEPVFQAHHSLRAIALAPAEIEEVCRLPGAEAAALFAVADEHDLLARQAELRRDLPIGEAHRLALALDLPPIETPDRIALAHLQVVAHAEHRLAEGGEHRVGDAELLARHPSCHKLEMLKFQNEIRIFTPWSGGPGLPAAPWSRSGRRACIRSTARTTRPSRPTPCTRASCGRDRAGPRRLRCAPRPSPPRRGSSAPPRTPASARRRRPCRSASASACPCRRSRRRGTAPGRTSCTACGRSGDTSRRTRARGTGSPPSARRPRARAR